MLARPPSSGRRSSLALRIALLLALTLPLLPSAAAARSSSSKKKRQKPPAAVVEEPAEPAPAAEASPPAAACEDPERPLHVRLLVMDLKTTEALASSSRALTQVVAEQAALVRGYDIVSTEEIRSVLDREATKQLLGCDDSGCLAEIAGALDAELLVSGLLEQTPDGAPVVTLALLNTRALVTVNRVSLTWRGESARLPDVTAAAAQRLLFEKQRRPPGRIVVAGLPEGARVVIDDVDRTSEHAGGAVGALEVGPHEVRVLADGYEPRVEYVLVQSDQVTNVDGTLEAVPLWSRWWFWTGAGTAVLASVGATAALLTLTGQSDVAVTSTVRAPTLADVERVKQ